MKLSNESAFINFFVRLGIKTLIWAVFYYSRSCQCIKYRDRERIQSFKQPAREILFKTITWMTPDLEASAFRLFEHE